MPEETRCASPLPGDTSIASCIPSLCTPDRPYSCGLCSCASCAFCTKSQSSSFESNSRRADSSLQATASSQRLLNTLQQRYVRQRGILLRLLECSLPCMSNASWSVGAIGAPCIVHQLGRKKAASSVLRWDLPASIFRNGRCVKDTPLGGVVASSGIGWIMCDPDERSVNPRLSEATIGPNELREDVAFAHDAWSPSQTAVNTNPPIRLSSCDSSFATQDSLHAYAEARFQGALARARGDSPRLGDGAYMNTFVRSAFNCHWPYTKREHAFDQQRAFVRLLAERQQRALSQKWSGADTDATGAFDRVFGTSASHAWVGGEEGSWGGLYNQVHATYGPADVCGVFYVNSTRTSHRNNGQQLPTSASFGTEGKARRAAAAEASKAHDFAQLAVRMISSLGVTRPPVLQLLVGSDSLEPRRVLERIAQGQGAADIRDVFDVPPSCVSCDLDAAADQPVKVSSTAAPTAARAVASSYALSALDRPPCTDTPSEFFSAGVWPSELVPATKDAPASCADVHRLGYCKRDILILCPATCGVCSTSERQSRLPREAFVLWGSEGSSSRIGRYGASNVARGAWLVCSTLGVLCHHHPGVFLRGPGAPEHLADVARCANVSAVTKAHLLQGHHLQEAGVSIAYVALMQKIVDRCMAPAKLGLREASCDPVLVFEDDVALPADVSPARARQLMKQALEGPWAFVNSSRDHKVASVPADYVQFGWCSRACSHAFQITVHGAAAILRHVQQFPACMWGSPDDVAHEEMWSIDDRLHYLCRRGTLRCVHGHHAGIDVPNTPDTDGQGLIKQRKTVSGMRHVRLLPPGEEVRWKPLF